MCFLHLPFLVSTKFNAPYLLYKKISIYRDFSKDKDSFPTITNDITRGDGVMTVKTDSSQSVYISKDVAMMLKVQESTLRKYCIMLEEHGYHFHKNEHGHRGFLDNDVITLRKLIEIKSHPDMTLKQSCSAVMTWVREKDMSKVDTDVITEDTQHDERYNELKEMIAQQNEILKQMAMKLDEQQRYIDERLEKRDQKLMGAIREMQEEKRMFLETAVTNKKPWWRFW